MYFPHWKKPKTVIVAVHNDTLSKYISAAIISAKNTIAGKLIITKKIRRD